jgi:hypothetical protein
MVRTADLMVRTPRRPGPMPAAQALALRSWNHLMWAGTCRCSRPPRWPAATCSQTAWCARNRTRLPRRRPSLSPMAAAAIGMGGRRRSRMRVGVSGRRGCGDSRHGARPRSMVVGACRVLRRAVRSADFGPVLRRFIEQLRYAHRPDPGAAETHAQHRRCRRQAPAAACRCSLDAHRDIRRAGSMHDLHQSISPREANARGQRQEEKRSPQP